jgi:hypothetical protein
MNNQSGIRIRFCSKHVSLIIVINRKCFGEEVGSVEQILEKLEQEKANGSNWANTTLQVMYVFNFLVLE